MVFLLIYFALMCTPSWYSSNPISGKGCCTLRGITVFRFWRRSAMVRFQVVSVHALYLTIRVRIQMRQIYCFFLKISFKRQ